MTREHMPRFLAAIATLFALGIANAGPAFAADPIAIVAAVNGDVSVKPADGKTPQQAAFGRPLSRGDKVSVGEGGAATVVFNDGNIIELSSGSAITIGGRMTGNRGAGPGASLPDEVFSQVSKYVTGGSRQKGLVALSALRSSNAEANVAMIVFPRMTDVITNRPALKWRPVPDATRYKVTVTGADGEVLSLEVSTNELVWPGDGQPLERDSDYVWSVEAWSDGGKIRAEETEFHVVASVRRDAIERHLEGISRSVGRDDSPATQFLAGTYLFSHGLYGDAADRFESLSRLSPESPAPHEALGNVYRVVGLMDLAAAEFERALTLTRDH